MSIVKTLLPTSKTLVSTKQVFQKGDLKIYMKVCPGSGKMTLRTGDHHELFKFCNSKVSTVRAVLELMLEAVGEAEARMGKPTEWELKGIPHDCACFDGAKHYTDQCPIVKKLMRMYSNYKYHHGNYPAYVRLSPEDWKELKTMVAKHVPDTHTATPKNILGTKIVSNTAIETEFCDTVGLTEVTAFNAQPEVMAFNAQHNPAVKPAEIKPDIRCVIDSGWRGPAQWQSALHHAKFNYRLQTKDCEEPNIWLTDKTCSRLINHAKSGMLVKKLWKPGMTAIRSLAREHALCKCYPETSLERMNIAERLLQLGAILGMAPEKIISVGALTDTVGKQQVN